MILAAGRGERMRPLTDSCPKPMLEVAGKPLIFYHLEKLAGAGVHEVVINHAWLGQTMEDAIGDGRQFGLTVHWSREPAGGLETAGGIIQALPLLGEAPFVVVNGDVWSDVDYAQLKPLGANDLGRLILVENPPHHPVGDFSLRNGQVELPRGTKTFTFSGLSVLSPQLFRALGEGVRKLKPVFERAIANRQLAGQVHQGDWCDVGTPERLDLLEARLTTPSAQELD